MAVRIEHAGDVAIVVFEGQLIGDRGGAQSSDSTVQPENEELQGELLKLLDSGQKRILLNLEGVHALDDTGLRALILFHISAGRRGSHFRICGLRTEIGRELCFMCLATLGHHDHTFRRTTPEEALQDLQGLCGTLASVKVEHTGEIAIVQPRGIFADDPEIEGLNEHMRNLFKTSPKNILVDLNEVFQLESAALGCILRGSRKPTERPTMVFVARPDSSIKEMLTVCGTPFSVYDTREEALSALQNT